jgi:hypothetical protein
MGQLTSTTVGTVVGCIILVAMAAWGVDTIYEVGGKEEEDSMKNMLMAIAIMCPVLVGFTLPSFWSTTIAQTPKMRPTDLMGDTIYLVGLTEHWPLAFPLCNVLCGFCAFMQFTLMCMISDTYSAAESKGKILGGLAPFAVALQCLYLLKDFVIAIKLLRQAVLENTYPMPRRFRFVVVATIRGALVAGALSVTVLARTTNAQELVIMGVASVFIVRLDNAILEAIEKLAPQATQDLKRGANSDGPDKGQALKNLAFAVQESGSLSQDIVRSSYIEMGESSDSDLSMDSGAGWSMGGAR